MLPGEGAPPWVMNNACFWNVRGLNNPKKQLDVFRTLRGNNIGFCGLVETKLKHKNAANVIVNIFSQWSVTSNFLIHKGSRILIAWLPNVFDVNITNVTTQMIHHEIMHIPAQRRWSCTFLYGFNIPATRRFD